MTLKEQMMDLQTHLKRTGRYAGAIDGIPGRLTDGGVLLMLTDGPDTPLNDNDLTESARRTNIPFANIKAVTITEANGAGFFNGRPKILPEPHRFSKRTGGKYDRTHPSVSYPRWGSRPYPKTQDQRYTQLLQMIRLDPEAGFASASYGKFQIMGENYKACGYPSARAFAEAQARDEQTQLVAFEWFLRSTGLLAKLAACTSDPETCRPFCRGYNGTGYEENNYHIKLAANIAAVQRMRLAA